MAARPLRRRDRVPGDGARDLAADPRPARPRGNDRRFALPVYAVFYTVWEAIFGIATGIIADAGNSLSGTEREGAAAAVDAIIASPIVGESGVFVSIGSLAWWTAISAAIMALKHAGVRRSALVLLGLGGLLTFHVPIGPPALVCLSIAAYLIDRDRARVAA